MSYIITENTDQLQERYTNEICTLLVGSRLSQQFEPLIMWNRTFTSPIPFILIIQLGKSYIKKQSGRTVYDQESHILGKAMRLLTHLEETDHLFDKLEPYNIKSILLTTVSDPQQMNDSNKWVLEASFAKTIVRQLIALKPHSISVFDAAIQSLVDENASR